MKNDKFNKGDFFINDNETSEELRLSELTDDEINEEYKRIFGNN